MMSLLLVLVGIAAGGALGRALAARGVTAANALEGHQGPAVLVVAVAGAIGLMVYFRHEFSWLPTMPSVYAEAALIPSLVLLTSFGVGLVACLEWQGRSDPKRRRDLAVSSGFLLFCLMILIRWELPVGGSLGAPGLRDGVVLQTTSYTCSPASIATLMRAVLGDSSATEASVVALTRTTLGGTSTLREIRAMEATGLGARFATGLTVDSLVANGPALLHVDEPVAGTTIRHAVALLTIDSEAQTIVIGNPLYGLQTMRFDEMDGYWIGEAIFVQPGG